jgi:hypothetical protein
MSIPAAWHPDPLGRHEYRYWDGTAWTEHVSDQGQVGQDPLSSEPVPTTDAWATPAQQPGQTGAGTHDPGQGPWQQPSQSGQQPPAAGQPPQQTWQQPQQPAQPAYVPPTAEGGSNGLALAALIIGLLSLLIAWIPFIGLMGAVGGVVAIILGVFGRGRAKKVETGAGLAITGIISGAVALLLGVVSTMLPVLFFQGMIGDFEAVDRCVQQTGDEDACLEEHAPGWVRFFEQLEDFEN